MQPAAPDGKPKNGKFITPEDETADATVKDTPYQFSKVASCQDYRPLCLSPAAALSAEDGPIHCIKPKMPLLALRYLCRPTLTSARACMQPVDLSLQL